MKIFKSLLIGLLVLFTLFSAFGGTLSAQAPSQEEQQEMMKKWMAYMTPGENHKYMEFFNGKWDAKGQMLMMPGTPPIEVNYEVDVAMLLGGRYSQSITKGMLMGQPFEGIGILSYDNSKKKFASFWIDNTGTGFYYTSGTLDKSGKIRTETGDWDDPIEGGTNKVRMITAITGPDTFTFQMYMTVKGNEIKNMDMIYTRKK